MQFCSLLFLQYFLNRIHRCQRASFFDLGFSYQIFRAIMLLGDIMEEYEVHLDNFEGPLDLLLHLIKEKEMDLLNLEIAKITEQYLAYIRSSQALHLEVASEYLVMATYLVETKSRMLLPKEKVTIEDTYEEDPRQVLINRLLEYKRYKDVVEALKIKQEARAEVYMKLPSNMNFLSDENNIKIPENLDTYDLIVAMQKLMQRKIRLAPMKEAVARKEISIDERTLEIKQLLLLHRHEKISFETLFDEGDKQLFVITFLAILVLANQKVLTITQENQFDEIYVEAL